MEQQINDPPPMLKPCNIHKLSTVFTFKEKNPLTSHSHRMFINWRSVVTGKWYWKLPHLLSKLWGAFFQFVLHYGNALQLQSLWKELSNLNWGRLFMYIISCHCMY